MPNETPHERSMNDTRSRILDVALEVLGQQPDAGMGDIAAAAGVVRRTVYGHFATRIDLVRTLTQRAVKEVADVLSRADSIGRPAPAVWVDFIAHLWPLTRRYRVLLALRRGEFGAEIHTLLGPVDKALGELVQRGQDAGEFGHHLPADLLSQIAYGAVFAIADQDLSHGSSSSDAATLTSLLILGVSESRAQLLLDESP